MLDKDKANAAAEAILATARGERTVFGVHRIPSMPELKRFDAAMQRAIVHEAGNRARRNWRYHLANMAWIAAWCLAWYIFSPKPMQLPPLALMFPMIVLPIVLMNTWVLRREIRKLCRDLDLPDSAA